MNPRWRTYIDFLKKGSINSRKEWTAFFMEWTAVDRWNRKLDEISDETRVTDEHETSLEHGARQPRLAVEADGPTNTKTRERTEGADKVVQAMRGDSYTAAQKVQDGPKSSISFGMMAEPPDLPCRKDVLVEEGATTPKSCLPSLEMRSPTAADGLVPNPEGDSKMEDSWTLTPSASYDSRSFWRLSATP